MALVKCNVQTCIGSETPFVCVFTENRLTACENVEI